MFNQVRKNGKDDKIEIKNDLDLETVTTKRRERKTIEEESEALKREEK